MTHHLLTYDYVADVAERRGPYREAHLERIRSEPTIIMAGALGDPVVGAAIVFRDRDEATIEAFVRADPYMQAGLITAWRVQPWTLV